MLQTIASFIVAIAILVVVHELGHYMVARWCGVRVIRFSVGFGKTLFVKQFTPGGTEWALAAVPLGGFVRMVDERDPDSLKIPDLDLTQAFNRKSVYQRMAIVLAGPLMNLMLAALLYGAVQMIGVIEPLPKLGQPAAGTLAAKAGLQFGDNIISMDGRAVYGWGDVNWLALSSMLNDDGLTIEVERQGARHTVTLKPTDPGWPGVTAGATSQLGLTPYETSVIVRSVSESGAGQRDGIQVGDVIKSLNGVGVLSSSVFTTQVRQSADQDILIGLERNGVALELRTKPDLVVPEDKSAAIGRLGIGLGGGIELQTTQQSLLDSLVHGVRHTWDVSVFSLIAFGKMVTGQMSLKMLSGPVTIADAAGQSARIGFTAYIAFLAMVSVSLGILNLLPVPVLDGGHLMYYFAEVVRGKPLADIWFEWGQKIGIVLIGAMSVIALFNDLQRVIFHG